MNVTQIEVLSTYVCNISVHLLHYCNCDNIALDWRGEKGENDNIFSINFWHGNSEIYNLI